MDDSGSPKNLGEKYFVLAGVFVFERQAHFIATEMDKYAETLFPGGGRDVEFHASEIFSGRSAPWNSIKDKNSRIDVIASVLKILADFDARVEIFACAVHKDSFGDQDSVEMAFEDLCSRFDKKLKRIYFEAQDPQRGIIILDKSSYETSLQKMALDFKSIGTRWGIISNLAEVPLFVDSRASRIIQLADHVAYAVFRRFEHGDTKYFDLIAHKFDFKDDILHGLAHKHNLGRCLCPACMSRG
ncbi:MAG: DUF3800 domain-containing protein [Nitrospinae bacterium]|nr:DUF3800 domain-containing protein [Nitrospinota bacterium]